jgi:hypothetical protein
MEGFSSLKADEWKTLFLVYATPIMMDLLPDQDKEILAYFVRACSILVCRIVEKKDVTRAHRYLLGVAKAIEGEYGAKKVSPNVHLSLHLAKCTFDYGPPYAYWCFPFERMNGMLGN